MGRWIIIAGLALVVFGFVVLLGERVGLRLGRLPGDLVWRGKNGAFYFPLMTSILLSLILTLVLWLFGRRGS